MPINKLKVQKWIKKHQSVSISKVSNYNVAIGVHMMRCEILYYKLISNIFGKGPPIKCVGIF